MEAILELLPEMPQQSQPQLPDLYAARDKLFEMPSLGGWKFEKGEKRDRFYAFASALIEEASKLDQKLHHNPALTIWPQASNRTVRRIRQPVERKTETIRKLTAKLGQRPFRYWADICVKVQYKLPSPTFLLWLLLYAIANSNFQQFSFQSCKNHKNHKLVIFTPL